MKHRFGILILLLSLLVVPTNSTLACGSNTADNAAKSHHDPSPKSCCSKDEAKSSDTDNTQSKDSDCPCGPEEGGCNCPGCGLVCHAGAAFAIDFTMALAIEPIADDSVQKRAFYFAQHMPEDVYRSIWQPPKIRA